MQRYSVGKNKLHREIASSMYWIYIMIQWFYQDLSIRNFFGINIADQFPGWNSEEMSWISKAMTIFKEASTSLNIMQLVMQCRMYTGVPTSEKGRSEFLFVHLRSHGSTPVIGCWIYRNDATVNIKSCDLSLYTNPRVTEWLSMIFCPIMNIQFVQSVE